METPEQSCAEMLAELIPSHPSRESLLRVLRIAYLHGYTDCLRADVVRLQTPVIEFPLRGAA